MEYVQKLVKMARVGKMKSDDVVCYSSYAIFGASAAYMFYRGQLATVGMAIGVAMILYAVTDGNMVASLIGGALAGLIAVHYSRREFEGFATEEDDDADASEHEKDEGFAAKEDDEGDDEEKPKPKAAKKRRAAPLPDNGTRAEMFKLGKKYEMPKEEDDGEYHLDAGTTFLNAYKSLKPDQINEMTKDTQELMTTQRQLMSTLQTLKPLITDGKEMMDMFQSYFGSGKNSLT